MKNIILILLLIVAGYMIYNYFFAEKVRKKFNKNEGLTTQDFAARQQEAQDMLRDLYQKEESFHARFGHYTYKYDSLGVASGNGTYYTMKVKDASTSYFEARADGNIDNDGTKDVWTIKEDGRLNNLVNDLEK